VLVLLLLAGVLGMHSLTSMSMSEMAMPSASTSSMPALSSPSAAGPAVLVLAPHADGTTGAARATAGGVGGQDQGVMHECLAVLTAALLLALIVLAVFGGVPERATVGVSTLRWRWGRAPPWTVPSLAQLSVLRV
jgi:hypothetical protein